jgi:hypothetical protein
MCLVRYVFTIELQEHHFYRIHIFSTEEIMKQKDYYELCNDTFLSANTEVSKNNDTHNLYI